MSVLRAINGSVEPIVRRVAVPAAMVATVVIVVAIPVLAMLSLAQGARSRSGETWQAHHEACHRIPEEVYHRDRFRAIRGQVTDDDGKPVVGALVRCVTLESLVDLARGGPPSPLRWSPPIEAETRTNERGRYEFPHLPIGGRTLFYSAPAGRDLAPAIKDVVVVQDGLGAQLNVMLTKSVTLLVRFRTPVRVATQLYLVPQRWWPNLETAIVSPAWKATEFRHLGGPFRKGLIATSGPDASSPLRIIGRYDLDRSAEVELSDREMPVLRYNLPEAAGLEPWRFEPSAEERLFYTAMSPVPLFWRKSRLGWPSWLPLPTLLERLEKMGSPVATGGSAGSSGLRPTLHPGESGSRPPIPADEGVAQDSPNRPRHAGERNGVRASSGRYSNEILPSSAKLASAPFLPKLDKAANGIVRGFAPHPFLPVLIESHTAGPRLTWTSVASEFEIDGLPEGFYRVRALDLFGQVTFAAGTSVQPGRKAAKDVRLRSKVALEEPNSRQLMGIVKWESGLPAAKAVVFVQNMYNPRKYVRRVETDEHGFFRFVDVQGDEPYSIFALPLDDVNAMWSMEHLVVRHSQREVWRELTLHPHRLKGSTHGLAIWDGDARSELNAKERSRASGALSEPILHNGRAPSRTPDETFIQLVRLEGESQPIVWTFRVKTSGPFTLSNVPHGTYRIQATRGDGKKPVNSLPFDVGDGRPESQVRWAPQ